MKLNPYIRKPWSIPRNLENFYGAEKIEKAISFFDRACDSNFYLIDYYKQKIIMGSSTNLTFGGYSRRAIVKNGFEIYNRMLKPTELDWLQEMNTQAFNVFHDTPESQRLSLEFIYYLIAKDIPNNEIVLRHKLVPFQLDGNGNMWLGLCFVKSTSYCPIDKKASIVNTETAEMYNYINGRFVLEKIETLTNDEVQILKFLLQDVPVKKIHEILNISATCFKLKRQKVFKKLNATSWYGAIHKAYELKIL